MLHTGEWISFDRMADWCAREGGSIDDRNNQYARLRAAAYRQLDEAMTSGQFDKDGRSRVVYPPGLVLMGYQRKLRMTREWYAKSPDGEGRTAILECCWVPRDMARRWLATKRVPLPPWLSSEDAAQGKKAVAPAKPHTPQAVMAAKNLVSHPQKRRGPPRTERNRAATMMVNDIRAGKRTLDELHGMKQDTLAYDYGLKSRDTARKALADAVNIVAISSCDKIAPNDK
jgi:hypothetical protein